MNEYENALNLLLRLGRILDVAALADALVSEVASVTGSKGVILLLPDDTGDKLHMASATPKLQTDFTADEISDPLVVADLKTRRATRLIAGSPNPYGLVGRIASATAAEYVISQPLVNDDTFTGLLLLLIDSVNDSSARIARLLEIAAPGLAITISNATEHTRMVQEAATQTRQLYILGQIDRELNETISLNHVFDMTLDWALRYTNAQCASLALYDETTDELNYVASVGYELSSEQFAAAHRQHGETTARRVARTGRPELIPDVSTDQDYLRLSPAMKSLLCAPILRDDRVVAVINVESKRLNGFTDAHIEFVEKLGARAGVAIDNARLFSEAVREREKLAHILSTTADGVIVVGPDCTIELINPSAIAAALQPGTDYTGQPFAAVLRHTPLPALYQRAQASGQVTVGEVKLPPNRTFYANLSPSPEVGWIIVMHDISPLKETERLKNELVATVSHDLKQPLSVMHGYTELILMHEPENPHIETFTRMIQTSIGSMRQLIDDLLDLGRLESGVQLHPTAVHLRSILNMCVEGLHHPTRRKGLQVTTSFPEVLPPVAGEQRYLHQIFMNLISNAVKYTPENGHIHITAEARDGMVRVTIQDDGIGISPEDQAHIFDRFFRVRSRDTEGIEGTGLGLAIVKRLVEIHGGQIGLSSRLGEGSTFYVTLPMYAGPENEQPV